MENEGNGGTVTGLCIHINLIVSMHKYFNSITIAVLYGPTNTEAYYITLHILHRPSGRRRGTQGEKAENATTQRCQLRIFYNAHRLGAVLIYTTIMRV